MHSRHIEELIGRGSHIRRAYEEGAKLKAVHGAEAVCDLSLGNPVEEPPPAFAAAVESELRSTARGQHRYMPNAGMPVARAAVAEYLAKVHGLPIRPEHVAMSVGAAGGLNALLKAILEPGDEVVQIAPYFAEYVFYIENHGGVVRTARTTESFDLDAESVARALGPRTRAVIVNSPNNPTGIVYPAASLARIGAVLADHEKKVGRPVLLIGDDPYSKIVFDGTTVPSIFAAHRHTVLVGSHSKDLGVPGERIGYVVAHPEASGATELIAAVGFATRILGFVNAPAFMQRLAARLQGVTVDPGVYQRRRDRLWGALREMGYACVKPQGAFYLFPRAPGDDDLLFTKILQKHLVLVVPGVGFGTPGFFRIAYCVEEAVIERALPRFRAALREAGGG